MTTSRRRFLGTTIAASALATAGWPTIARSQERDEIVIGFQNDLTGLLASYGYWYEKTAKAAIARINGQGGIAGKKVRLVSRADVLNRSCETSEHSVSAKFAKMPLPRMRLNRPSSGAPDFTRWHHACGEGWLRWI